jgi:hypothetical protein
LRYRLTVFFPPLRRAIFFFLLILPCKTWWKPR